MECYKRVEREFYAYRGKKEIIGTTDEGRHIFAFFVGSAYGKQGICQYGIHAREYLTTFLALEHIRYGLSCGGVWFLPLTNPDGAELCLNGIATIKQSKKRDLLKKWNGGTDFSLWKANGNGVDLNVNFDAGWGKGEKNIRYPASQNFIGRFPFSEKESCALRDFTCVIRPDFTISYHTAGEEIYYRYKQPPLRSARDKKLALLLSKSTGYPLGNAGKSHGGYKDWCILKYKIPSFTIEAGRGKQPLPFNSLQDIIPKNLNAVRDLIDGWNYAK